MEILDLGDATSAIGKWHLGHLLEYLPVKQGFDEYYGILYSNDMRPVQLVENETVVDYPVVQALLTQRYTQRALDFIDRNKDRPFFLYLPHAMPHKPLAASEDFYTPDTPEDLYADVIRELDWSVGQVLAKLKEAGIEENTLVMFLSDNGPYFGGRTGGLRGMKGRTWDGGVRVPMIARWPGRIPGGHVLKEVAASIDIFPTLVKLAGGTIPGGRVIDGKDIYPLLTSADAKSPHDGIFAMQGPQLRIVRSGKWKLHVRSPGTQTRYQADVSDWIDLRAPDGVTIIAPYEQAKPNQHPGVLTGDTAKDMMLFDMEADPAEQHDVAAEHPEVVERLKAVFDKIDAQVPSVSRPPKGRTRRIRRLKGGELRYDREANP